jgi:hypothetical protein
MLYFITFSPFVDSHNLGFPIFPDVGEEEDVTNK